jgi:CHAD domain-containing protein
MMRQQHERRRLSLVRESVKRLERLEIARLLHVLGNEQTRWSRHVPWRATDRRWKHDLRDTLVARSRSAIDAIDHATGIYFPRRSHTARIAIKKLRYAMEIAQATRVADRDRAIRELKKGQDVLGDLHDRQTLIDELGRDMLGDQPGADRDVQVMKQVLEAECHQLHSQYLARRTGLLAVCRAEQRESLRNHQPVGLLVAAGAGAVSAAIYLAHRPRRRTHVDCFADSVPDEGSINGIVETTEKSALPG